MNTARKQAMAIFAALVKHAQDDDEYPELPRKARRRGVGQRFFEGGMTGAGAGLGTGALAGALIGGYRGYLKSRGRPGPDAQFVDKAMIKEILSQALAGAGIGAGLGAAAGGTLGATGSVLLGSRKQQPTF